MAGKEKTYPVFIDKIDLGKVFDDKAVKEMPDLVASRVADGLGKPFEVVKSKPKDKGFYISGTITTIDYDEGKEALSAKLSLILSTMPGRSMFTNISTGGKLGGVKAKKLDALLRKLIESMADKCAKDASGEMEKKARDM
jgi:hypothetical protein